MSFRTVEISNAAEIHIRSGQLIVTQDKGTATIPIEDIAMIMLHGANIRLSSMDLSILTENKVAVMTLDDRYLPTAIVLPFEGHARQSKLMHAQVAFAPEKYRDLWLQIISGKIENQSRTLSILGLDGVEEVASMAGNLSLSNIDHVEANAANTYFSFYHQGLNRRSDDPVNSRLNYGYAVVRSAIARSLVYVGFHPTFGIHHNSQLNPFNLADDLIEPFRAIVDLTASECMGKNQMLNRKERQMLAHVLYNACLVEGIKVNIITAIDLMNESLKRIILESSDEQLLLPTVLPLESLEGVTE